MDLAVQTQGLQGDDKSWLGDAHGVDMGIPIELNLALFDLVTAFPNGFLPSGIVIARLTSSGAYGMYDPGTVVNESVSIVATGGTAGDFTASLDGETSGPIAWNATAAAVLAVLEAMSNIDPGDVTVTGGPLPATPVVITFATGGQYADRNVADLTITDNITNGTATPTITQGGGAGAATGGAGLEVAKGHLLFPVSTTDARGVNLVAGARPTSLFAGPGRVREAKLPTGHGLDAAAKAALPLIQYLSVNGDVS